LLGLNKLFHKIKTAICLPRRVMITKFSLFCDLDQRWIEFLL